MTSCLNELTDTKKQLGQGFNKKSRDLIISEDKQSLGVASNGSNEEKPAQTTTGNTTSTLPAWVFCTRYSDRPSAGN